MHPPPPPPYVLLVCTGAECFCFNRELYKLYAVLCGNWERG
jgi:hypothetical protein